MGLAKDLARLREAQPQFASFFLDYDQLKAVVESKDADATMSRLQSELDRVNYFVEMQWEVFCTELKKQMRKDVPEDFGSLENLSEAIIQLHDFVSLSYACLAQIVRRCGEQQETASCTWFSTRLESAAFRTCNFDALLAQLGQLYASWRAHHDQASAPWSPTASGAAAGGAEAQAFFVPPAKVMRTKVGLLKLVQPATRTVRVPTTSTTRSSGEVTHGFKQNMSHVYFDNPKGDQYAERYRRLLGGGADAEPRASALLHCHWLADAGASPGTTLLLDVEDAEGRSTTATLLQRDMPALLEGKLDPAAAAERPAAQAAGDSQAQRAALEAALAAIKEGGLKTSVSATFLRSSFVGAGQGAQQIAAMDEELFFRDEGHTTDSWCSAAGSKGEASGGPASGREGFPGAMLRLWMPTDAAEALLDKLGDMGLRPLPGFSEALHGMALFHRELAVPLPPWIPGESLPTPYAASTLVLPQARAAAAEGQGAVPAKPPPAKPRAPPQPAAPGAGTEAKSLKAWLCGATGEKKTVVDPKLLVDLKTPLASERTAIRWYRSAVLLASLSGLLLAGETGAAQVNGALLGLSGALFVALPAVQFWKRSLEFAHPVASQPKVDRTLPKVLAGTLAVTFSAALCVDAVGQPLPP
mmetsp:Transcript_36653/g.116663  ORF Transcript_36653/g.116663 Transcript_36653/m.116663 type:complete len:642 (-) Transcript_36653:84-2009(-)